MARILITDGDNRSALAATRSLGRTGHTVFVAAEAHPSLASVSRHASGFDIYCSPNRSPQQFVADVASIIERRQIDVLLPMTEITTVLLARAAASLPANVRMPFPEADIVEMAADKARVLDLAKRIGVPAPLTYVLQSANDVEALIDRLDYPAVYKPSRSRTWTGSHWVSSGTGYARTADELRAGLQKLQPAVFPVLIQERIEGPGVGVFVCCDETRVLATFSHQRLREKPPSGGVSVLCESAPVDPTAREHATRLLREIRWRGVAMVEFKQDLRDGSLKLMEINGRFWGSLQLAIDAGIDFPRLAVDIALNQAEPVRSYRTGVRSRWFWGDLDAMIALLRRNPAQLNLPRNHPGRWRTLLSFMRFWQTNTRYELERRDDPRPALLAAKRWLLNRQ